MSKSALYAFVVLLAFWTAVVGLGDVFVFGATTQQFLSRNFVPTKCEIRSSKLTERLLITAGVTIDYSYTVNGKLYRGSGYRYDDQQSAIQAAQIIARYPKWSEQIVHYNPKNPADSVLSTGVDGTDLLQMLYATPMNVVLLFLWRWVLARFQDKRRVPVAGGVKVRRHKGCIRLRVDGISAWEAGLYALGIAAFLITFPLVMLGGFAPDVQMLVLAWVLVLAVSMAAFCWKGIQNASGLYDVWIDENSRTVTLPQTCGRTQRATYTREEIAGIALLSRSSRLTSGNYYSYLPTVIRLDAARRPHRERLTAWGWSEERALGFSQWLCQQLAWDFKGVEEEHPEAAG
jgi:Protein of unknown function (DUF3592)